LKIADSRLFRQAAGVASASENVVYVEPRYLHNSNYERDMKSDVYSFGILLWEISSGRPPFYIEGEQYDISLIHEISQGLKEKIIPGTPEGYANIYTGKYTIKVV
jgi:serine/threonine protein kinase